ncbi:MAG: SLBB domain-containing protein [Ignavibacteriaceae bacterium]
MKFIQLIIVIFQLSCWGNFLFSQNFPNSQERYLSTHGDTLATQNYSLLATGISIDPQEYIVGPGDRIFISISGLQELTFNLVVNQEGFLFIPKVGAVDLKNISLATAKEKLSLAINRSYKNVDLFISISDLKKITVSLLGDVLKPASYELTGNSRLIDLIAISNGMTKTSDYRNIKIISAGNVSKKYDLFKFLRFADKKSNPLLQDGDAVIVDRVDKIVSILGEVKFPGAYEYLENESAADLIDLAGGFLTASKKDTIEVVRFEPDGKNQFSLYYSYDDLVNRKIVINNNDQIFIRKIPDYYVSKHVEVTGWVKYPGIYKIVEDQTTLKDIIEEAGGFRKDASLTDATLLRTMGTVEHDPEYNRIKEIPRKDMTDDEYDYFKAKSRERAGSVVVDFVGLFKMKNVSENVVLKNSDVINVPEAKNYITLIGQVVNPGNVIYQKDLNVDGYIKLAGGFGWRAVKGDVRVVRSNSGEWVNAGDVITLNPGDVIWVPEKTPAPKFWDVFTTSLQVVGEVAAIIAATVAITVASRK